LLYGDMLQIVRNYTKWAWEVKNAAEIPVAFARAFKIAMTPPTGPVFISLPVDAMEERAEIEFPAVTDVRSFRLGPGPARVEKAAAVRAQAANPVILAGDGCARCHAVPDVVALAETLGARVYTE